MDNRSIGFIGSGRVARLMVGGWAKSGAFNGSIVIFDKNPDATKPVMSLLPRKTSAVDSVAQAASCEVVILAVHPPVMMDTLAELKPFLADTAILISLAPKITISAMEKVLGGIKKIVRVNPSAPGIIGMGLNPVAWSEDMDAKDQKYIMEIFGLLGTVKSVPEETLEAYALISAIGPTYFWFQIQTLRELAVEFGLSEKDSVEAIELMMDGAVKTLFHSGMDPDAVMDLVPVKPLGEKEQEIRQMYTEKLRALYTKIKP